MGKKVAVTGKGGCGKTAITAIMTGILAKAKELRILAIDADSAISLPYALGIKTNNSVGELRRKMIEDPAARAEIRDKGIQDVMARALKEGDGFHLLVMGRPEGPGCYCTINDLLKYGIERISHEFDITLIDCEAGPEQVNRRVVQGVDILVIVTDATIRGIEVACAISEVVHGDEAMRSTRTGLVINRAKDESKSITQVAEQRGLEILGLIPEDKNITDYDLAGKPLIDLPNTSPSVVAIRNLLEGSIMRKLLPSEHHS